MKLGMSKKIWCLMEVLLMGLVSSACIFEKDVLSVDDTKNIGYSVNISSGFQKAYTKGGNACTPDSKTIEIEKLEDKFSGQQLYLHTTTQDWAEVKKNAEAKTKGAIAKGTLEKMVVSAWVYDAEYDGGKQYFLNETVENPGNNALWNSGRYWPMLNDNLHFYAFSPSGVQTVWEDGIPSIPYTIPSDVAEQKDLLVAGAHVENELFGQPVNMYFKHALTAVQFKVEGLEGLRIDKITIEGLKNSETFTYSRNTSADEKQCGSWSTSDKSADSGYELDFTKGELAEADRNAQSGFLCPDGEAVLNSEDGNFILFLMPQTLGEGAQVILEGYDTVRGEEVNLSAPIGGTDEEGKAKEWKQGQLVVYKISISNIAVEYIFEVEEVSEVPMFLKNDKENDSIPVVDNIVKYVPFYGQIEREFAVKSYMKTFSLGATEPTITPLEWYIDETENPIPAWIDRITVKSGAGIADENLSESVVYDVIAQTPSNSGSHENLKNFKYNNSTLESAYDLSTVSGSMNTANCYIVDAAGYYKLPLVYGNAIVNGSDNVSAYTSSKSGGTVSDVLYNTETSVSADYKVMTNFFNYAGPNYDGNGSNGYVTSPWIKDDNLVNINNLQAEVVWVDEPCLVTEAQIIGDYLYFRLREDCICEGNAVVALKDKGTGEDVYGNGGIVWSWHIWVTDKDNADISITSNEDFEVNGVDNFAYTPKFTLMNVPLGYCNAEEKTYEERVVEVKFRQVKDKENGILSEPKTFTIIQSGGYQVQPDNVVYYQYGRKDPIIPGYQTTTKEGYKESNKPYYTERRARYSLGFGGGRVGFHQLSEKEVVTNGGLKISHGISMPGQMFQTPQKFMPEADVNSSTLRVRLWYGNGYFADQDIYVNLWNNNNNLLPMFSYPKDATSEYVFNELVGLLPLGVIKTIYDPSPAGYEVPSTDAFTAFTYGGLNNENDIIYNPLYASSCGLFSYANGFSDFKFEDNNVRHFSIGAFGYRGDERGDINMYGKYGGALTANLLCVQRGNDVESDGYMDPYFQIGSSRLYFKTDAPQVFWPLASSSLANGFPIIPARTGQNRY